MNMTKDYNPKEYRRNNNMKGIKTVMLLLALIAMLIFNTGTASAAAKDNYTAKDKKLIVKYCKKHYDKKPVKIVKEGKVPKIRKGKRCVYVEQVKTISKGNGWGQAKGGKVRYNRPVKKGKMVTVYAIWNPRNNACDDVVAVVCQGKIRCD